MWPRGPDAEGLAEQAERRGRAAATSGRRARERAPRARPRRSPGGRGARERHRRRATRRARGAEPAVDRAQHLVAAGSRAITPSCVAQRAAVAGRAERAAAHGDVAGAERDRCARDRWARRSPTTGVRDRAGEMQGPVSAATTRRARRASSTYSRSVVGKQRRAAPLRRGDHAVGERLLAGAPGHERARGRARAGRGRRAPKDAGRPELARPAAAGLRTTKSSPAARRQAARSTAARLVGAARQRELADARRRRCRAARRSARFLSITCAASGPQRHVLAEQHAESGSRRQRRGEADDAPRARTARAQTADFHRPWRSRATSCRVARSAAAARASAPRSAEAPRGRGGDDLRHRAGCPRSERARRRLHHPVRRRHPRSRSAAATGQRVHDVADRGEPHDEAPSPSSAEPPEPVEQLARVVVLGIADDGHAPAVRAHHLALGHRLRRVVGALAVHVGPQGEEQRA